MESAEFVLTKNQILCCQCGIAVEPNPANMCVACIRSQVDITENIPKQGSLYFCKFCERYLQPPNHWIHCSLESRELLSLCLKKLKSLNETRLVDAAFIWTEPHSKRIKQQFVVEFTICHQICEDCRRFEAKDYWKAVVQIRQKTGHRKTFYYLEQLVLRHKMHEQALNIKAVNDGVDFYFGSENISRKFVDFLLSVVPCKYQTSKKLKSHDIHSNTYNFKHSFSVEISPVCKDDIVCLSSKLAQSLGGISQISIVSRVCSSIHLIDPFTAQIAEVSSATYWHDPFHSLCNFKQLQKYMVVQIEPLEDAHLYFQGQGPCSSKHKVVDVWLARNMDVSENIMHTRTHLGYLLHPGDIVLGLDLANCNVNNKHFDKIKKTRISDVILVKKNPPEAYKNVKRIWKLKHLNDMHLDDFTTDNMDYMEFLEDIEIDKICRDNINIYKSETFPVHNSDEYTTSIPLDEMLEDYPDAE